MIAFFFGSLTLLEGKSVGDAKERIQEAYVPTLIRNWYVIGYGYYTSRRALEC